MPHASLASQTGICGLVLSLAATCALGASPSTSTRPLTDQETKAIHWIADHQLKNGAWGQGEESRTMGNGLANIKDSPNVADTCMAVMALCRAGSSPKDGSYHTNIVSAVNFICDQIEKSDDNSLSITELKGTRTQIKLGENVDTFFACQTLSELKNQMPDDKSTQRVATDLARVVHKIQANQKDNGQWAASGWAPTLAQMEAAKAINSVVLNNAAPVDEKVREKAEQYARADFRANGIATSGAIGGGLGGAGSFDSRGAIPDSVLLPTDDDDGPTTGPSTRPGVVVAVPSSGNAGVSLYSAAAQISAMQASANNNHNMRQALMLKANDATTSPSDRVAATDELKRFDQNDKDLARAQNALVSQMNNQQFMNGFGSDGGEEFLSYLNIGESLYIKGGKDWTDWSIQMTKNLEHIQNDDGSFSGDHCITGRTFCTAAALQVLTIDRNPPLATAEPTTQNSQVR